MPADAADRYQRAYAARDRLPGPGQGVVGVLTDDDPDAVAWLLWALLEPRAGQAVATLEKQWSETISESAHAR